MKLLKVKLANFRQFYGEQEIVFAQEPDRNVTLIHAENGVGKTTLLNSILWCFYEHTTEKFERKNEIVNFQAVSEGETSALVEVHFEHDGSACVISRQFTARGNRPEVRVNAFGVVRGSLREIDAAESFINSVIPRPMAPYYFFDGEQAETFAKATSNKVIAQAIRNMLGSLIAETAIDDLLSASKRFRGALATLPGASELEQVTKLINEEEDKLADRRAALDKLNVEREGTEEQIRDIEQALRTAEGAKILQEQRDSAERQLRSISNELAEAETEIVRWVGTQATAVIAVRLSETTLSFIDEQSLRGRIPSPYNETFVRELLHDETCVCGRDLLPGTTEYGRVAELLGTAGNADVLNRVIRIRSRIAALAESRKAAPDHLSAIQRRVEAAVERRRALEVQIDDIGSRLAGARLEEIAERERARQQLTVKRDEILKATATTELRVRALEKSIRDRHKQQEDLAAKSGRAEKVLMRVRLTEKSVAVLRGVLEKHESTAREQIANHVNEFLDVTTRRLYRFEFSDDFGFELRYEDGRPVPRSSGENQLVSLAFIAALIRFSMSRSNQNTGILIPGIVAPLVLDSPFGQLDARYRIATAGFVPQMAEQVVLMVSSSQGDQNTLGALRRRVGREYVLIAENRGPRGGRASETLVAAGREIRTALFDCERDRTVIEEV